jgi:MFS family permease
VEHQAAGGLVRSLARNRSRAGRLSTETLVTVHLPTNHAPPWRQPEWRAAALNGALMLIVPMAWLAYGDYTWEVGRPSPPTMLSSTLRSIPVALGFAPVALLVVWRTYVHSRAYRLARSRVWRGPAESAGIAGGMALVVMAGATTAAWAREPASLVLAYIAFYAGAAALAGLALGILLAASALLVLHASRDGDGRREEAARAAPGGGLPGPPGLSDV